ncbi:MAG: hypothetical protein HOP19_16360 [Acidobacteria bacterium]|nr:hypothetical protein [Acidobacteriota bacterium]
MSEDRTWIEDGLIYSEVIRQEYGGNNCVISAGTVEGENKPKVDCVYLRLEKDSVEPTVLLLRPDEMQSIAWVASGAIWSHLMAQKQPD